MPRPRSFNLADTLSPELLSREAIQLTVAAALAAAAYVFAPDWLRVIVGVLSAFVALTCAVALVVAWRHERLRTALPVYVPAAAVFTVLALANILA
jgi:hypothetical protein